MVDTLEAAPGSPPTKPVIPTAEAITPQPIAATMATLTEAARQTGATGIEAATVAMKVAVENHAPGEPED